MPTEVISSIKPAGGGDYTSLNAWEAAKRSNIVTADQIQIAEVYSGGNSLSAQLSITTGWTTNSTHYVEIRAASGYEHAGTYDLNKAYASTSTMATIIASIDIKIKRMQIICTAGGGFQNGIFQHQTSNKIIEIDRCIIKGNTTGGVGCQGIYLENTVYANVKIHNTIIMMTGSASSSYRSCIYTYGGCEIYNCTMYAQDNGESSNSYGIKNYSNTNPVLSNNNYICAKVCYYDPYATLTKGANDATNTSEATTASLRSIAYSTDNFTNVSAGSEDYHIFDTSALYHEGTVIAGVGNDIVDVVRGATWDIGAFAVEEIVFTDVPIAKLGGYLEGVTSFERSAYVGGYISGTYITIPPIKLGGYLSAKALTGFNRVGILGGLLRAIGLTCPYAELGGYISSVVVKDVPIAKIGGSISGLYTKYFNLGGYLFGRPISTSFIECHARTLIKAKSDEVYQQALDIDANVVFKGLKDNDFNAQFQVEDTGSSEFGAEFTVEKYKQPPQVFIQTITPGSGNLVNGVRKITVVASGILMDGQEWKHASIDFGEPFASSQPLIFNENASISGFTSSPYWMASHDYHASGVYVITVRAIDNYGMVGMDARKLNLASGLTAGVQYPYMAISATPRNGIVPDPLLVSFTVSTSGISSIKTPADENILWNFGNLENSQFKSPKTYYSSPGEYAPKLMWRWKAPNGQYIWIEDTLLIGFNY